MQTRPPHIAATTRQGPRLSPVIAPAGKIVEPVVVNDLPKGLAVTREELAIWRAFLADEIDAILRKEA